MNKALLIFLKIENICMCLPIYLSIYLYIYIYICVFVCFYICM